MKRFWIMLLLTLILPNNGFGGTAADYLIMQDIGQYKFMGKGGGLGSGIIAATGHFSKDHTDESYGGMYFNEANEIGVNVEVTKHSGSDSDKWLLHEVDKEFRNYYGVPDPSYMVKTINNNLVMAFGAAGWNYRWISGNKIVMIEYHDSKMTKPEPVEIVSAYLVKHPSTLSSISTVSIRTVDNTTIWIKDEMDRRLWLCDKWFMQLQLQKVDEKKVLQESFESMKVFLKYRERYYGIKSDDEENLIYSYLLKNNGTAIKAKLDEYKKWWALNQDKAISIP